MQNLKILDLSKELVEFRKEQAEDDGFYRPQLQLNHVAVSREKPTDAHQLHRSMFDASAENIQSVR